MSWFESSCRTSRDGVAFSGKKRMMQKTCVFSEIHDDHVHVTTARGSEAGALKHERHGCAYALLMAMKGWRRATSPDIK